MALLPSLADFVVALEKAGSVHCIAQPYRRRGRSLVHDYVLCPGAKACQGLTLGIGWRLG